MSRVRKKEGERFQISEELWGISTISADHTGGIEIGIGMPISARHFQNLLSHYLELVEKANDRLVIVSCHNNPLDVLCSLVFNIG